MFGFWQLNDSCLSICHVKSIKGGSINRRRKVFYVSFFTFFHLGDFFGSICLFAQSYSSLHSFTPKQIDLKNSPTIGQSQFIEPPSSESDGQDVRSYHSLHAFPSPSTRKLASDHRPARTTRCRKENRAVPTAAFIMPAKPIDIGGQSR